MKFYIDTFVSAINAQIVRASSSDRSNIIVTLPSLDAECLLRMSATIVDYCAKTHASYAVTIKMARELVALWQEHQRAEAEKNGWVAEGSLTEWRNKAPKSKESLLILIGVDKIADQGSLADFLSLSTDYLFRTTMGGNFKSWAGALLKKAGIPSTKDAVTQLNEVLTCVNGLPGSGLLAISAWLETLPVKECSTEKEIAALFLSKLGTFSMPGFESYAECPKRKRKTLKEYFTPAADLFVFYDLSSTKKTQYHKAIDVAREEISEGKELFSGIRLGYFSSETEFLDALYAYVETGDRSAKEQFFDCDFFPVFNKIFKLKEKKQPKVHPKTLNGAPVDVFLTAVWETIRDFHKSRRGEEKPNNITISLKTWTYGSEGGDDENYDGNKNEAVKMAEDRLRSLIGGIDDLFVNRLSGENMPDALPPGCTCVFDRENLVCDMKRVPKSTLDFAVNIDGCKRSFVWRIVQQDDWVLGIELIRRCASKVPLGAWLPTFRLEYYEEMLASSNESDTREILLHALNEAGTVGDGFCVNMLAINDIKIIDPLLNEHFPKLGIAYAKFIKKCTDKGILHAIFDTEGTEWHDLCELYQTTCEEASNLFKDNKSELTPLLMRAFLITPHEGCNTWEDTLSSGIVTTLHPALMQMLEARIVFLFSCFSAACAKAMNATKWNTIAKIWDYYTSLAEIHSPIEVLKDSSSSLTVDSRGSGLIHKIGHTANGESKPLSTRLGMEPDDSEKS
ncbi:MAG: hypothetical protein IJU76_05255, partial [Desulfovibrionaceae bacterium]|nr:hypothetical protein [Desulfovibrionaceae bacterium]